MPRGQSTWRPRRTPRTPSAVTAPARPGDLPPDGVARRRLLELLGLAARAGGVVAGTDAVRRAVRDDEVRRVVVAEDAAPGQVGKLTPLLEARRVPFHTLFTRDELGAAIGRDAIAAVGLTNQNLARRAGELLAGIRTRDSASSRGPHPRGD